MKRLFYIAMVYTLLALVILTSYGFASDAPIEGAAREPEIFAVPNEPEITVGLEPVIFDVSGAFDEPVIFYEEDEFGQVWEIVVDNPEGIITEPKDYEVVNAGIEPGFSYGGLYAQAFTVVSVERDCNDYDEVQIMDGNGFIFVFYSYGSDWCVGDGCACVMDMNGTPEIFDDIILSARYFA